jgi:PAS domain S-box-containing protein
MRGRFQTSGGMRLVAAYALGAAVLCTLAIPQRLMLGLPPELVFAPRGFVIPFFAGGLGALALALAFERIRASEARYRIVADLATELIFWRRPDGSLLYVSPSCLAVTGWSAEELVADPDLLERMVHPEDRDLFANHRHALGPAGKVGRVDFRIVRRDGEIRWISHLCRPVGGPGGEPAGVRGSHQDVTEQRALEHQLRQAQKMDALGRIAASVAHDFNNAVTAIAASAEYLALSAGDAATRRSAEEVMQAAHAATRLTRTLLVFSRREPAAVEALDLRELGRDFERMLRRVVGPGVTLTVDAAGPPLRARADASQLQQVLVNLATNARDAMPGGGPLAVRFERVRVAQVPAAWAPPAGSASPGWHAVIVVADGGAGMDVRTREHLFEPFFTTKAAGQGTGLGLSVVDGIVREHGGFVTVESEPGRGATFRVHLPDATPEALRTPAPAGEPEPAPGSRAAGV